MMRLTHIALIVALSATRARAESVRHIAPAEAEAGVAVELTVEATAETPQLIVHVRRSGSDHFTAIELVRRDADTWVAVIPGTQIVTPGVEYYMDAGRAPVFATPQWPHRIAVRVAKDDSRRQRDLARSNYRRSRIAAVGEYVDFGTHSRDRVELADRYYRVDADFTYRLWAYPIETLRVGYTRLIGDADSTMCSPAPCTDQAGFKVGGWFEVGLGIVEGIHVDGRATVMATRDGFGAGARGELRVGERDSNHVALGGEYLQHVGSSGWVRLAFASLPRLPMAMTVEATRLPASDAVTTGIRLYYDLARELVPGFRVGARVGYAARVQQIGGVNLGLGLSADF